MHKPKKLYCYVDETGQDTTGDLFIVVSVVVAEERNELDDYLVQIEASSGIRKKKWVRAKSSPASRDEYLAAINTENFKYKLFYATYANTGTGAYEQLTVLAITQAINLYRKRHAITGDYKVSVIIDGLKRSEEARIGKHLREVGVASKKVRGARDESEPLIRLADRIAGLVRDANAGGKTYQITRRELEKQGIINKL